MISGSTSLRLFAIPPTRTTIQQSILVVDDNSMNRALVKRAIYNLYGNSISIIEAIDGNDAVSKVKDKIQQTKESFDVIIMDNEMPGMNGVIATAEIRSLEKIALLKRSYIFSWSTSFNMDGSTVYPLANDALSKPLNAAEFKQKLYTNLSPTEASVAGCPAPMRCSMRA